jgi:hypothetical protein
MEEAPKTNSARNLNIARAVGLILTFRVLDGVVFGPPPVPDIKGRDI